ncbi:hypothetical protein LguiB_025177 [Lonicera macranthoides]
MMEEGLLVKERNEEGIINSDDRWRVLCKEVKSLGYVAGPMVAVNLSAYLLQVTSVMMVGHLGELPLSSTAVAISLSGVTGFSLLMGMSSGLETLCGQAYGAHQYKKIGTQTYTAIFSLIMVCIPLSLLWAYMGKILVFIGQDHLISREAGKFTMWLIPSLFAFATYQPLVRYFQMQSLIIPMLITSCATLSVHIPLCWLLVFKFGLNSLGAAVAIDVSMWSNVMLLFLWMNYSSTCAKTRVPISMEVLDGVGEFFRFAIPSAVMTCLEWWSFELLILLSGILPNPELEASVLSVWYVNVSEYFDSVTPFFGLNIFLLLCVTSLNTISTLYTIPTGLGAGASTRVSNELGAGNPQGARLAVFVVMFLAVTEAVVVSGSLFVSRHIFGYMFSNGKEVVDYIMDMAPLVCLSVVMDSLQGVLSGIARGCGWQHIGAYVNFGAFYLFGIPIAVVLAFCLQLRGKGLWIGIQAGSFLQTTMLSVITSRTNWEKQATKAREQIFK